jgi:hypothetical protein
MEIDRQSLFRIPDRDRCPLSIEQIVFAAEQSELHERLS